MDAILTRRRTIRTFFYGNNCINVLFVQYFVYESDKYLSYSTSSTGLGLVSKNIVHSFLWRMVISIKMAPMQHRKCMVSSRDLCSLLIAQALVVASLPGSLACSRLFIVMDTTCCTRVDNTDTTWSGFQPCVRVDKVAVLPVLALEVMEVEACLPGVIAKYYPD